jgi:hypothetical protein
MSFIEEYEKYLYAFSVKIVNEKDDKDDDKDDDDDDDDDEDEEDIKEFL